MIDRKYLLAIDSFMHFGEQFECVAGTTVDSRDGVILFFFKFILILTQLCLHLRLRCEIIWVKLLAAIYLFIFKLWSWLMFVSKIVGLHTAHGAQMGCLHHLIFACMRTGLIRLEASPAIFSNKKEWIKSKWIRSAQRKFREEGRLPGFDSTVKTSSFYVGIFPLDILYAKSGKNNCKFYYAPHACVQIHAPEPDTTRTILHYEYFLLCTWLWSWIHLRRGLQD